MSAFDAQAAYRYLISDARLTREQRADLIARLRGATSRRGRPRKARRHLFPSHWRFPVGDEPLDTGFICHKLQRGFPLSPLERKRLAFYLVGKLKGRVGRWKDRRTDLRTRLLVINEILEDRRKADKSFRAIDEIEKKPLGLGMKIKSARQRQTPSRRRRAKK